MVSGGIRNPLYRRLPRELKDNFSRYLAIFLLLLLTISFVSGFLVADHSMLVTYNESFTKYNVEDGNFRVHKPLNRAQEKGIRALGISVYENFYAEPELDSGSTLRVFRIRTDVNTPCLMEGALPQGAGELAVDRMFADNNGISVGDTIRSGAHVWTVSGLVALPDYSALFRSNSDAMFDSVLFGVAVADDPGFEALSDLKTICCYSWKYDTPPADEAAEKAISDTLLDEMAGIVSLEDFVPRYQNQAITFTGNDMGKDGAMMQILLIIILVILAFVFAVIASDTIRREAPVIGTLLASGYTRGELLRHYMVVPLLITLLAAALGNVLGYTFMKEACAAMYYGSYSLPTYVTVWSSEALLKTTVLPVGITLAVTGLVLCRRLTLPPLKFLRRDLRKHRQKKALPLPHRLGIFRRYRLRIFFQNLSSFCILFIGILFANVLLMFGMMLPKMMDHYQETVSANLIAGHQYLLKLPLSLSDDSGTKLEQLADMLTFLDAVETENPDAEKFSVNTLRTEEIPGIHYDDVLIYGIAPESRYFTQELGPDDVLVSSGYAEKYRLSPGDTIALREVYGTGRWSFTVTGICEYPGSVSIFMPQDRVNRLFDYGKDGFTGYFSDSGITDIDPEYIGQQIDLESLTSISRQLLVSMGGLMGLVDGFAVILFVVLIYLLSKLVIEKNAQSISMTKILGYTNAEIARLYIVSLSVVTILSMEVTIPLVAALLRQIFYYMLRGMMAGWLPLWLDPAVYGKMFAIGVLTYAAVALLEYRKIRKVPMEEALKNVE